MNKHDFIAELIKCWVKYKAKFSIFPAKIENLGDVSDLFYDTKDFDYLIRGIVTTEISFNELIKIVAEAVNEKEEEFNTVLADIEEREEKDA